MIYTPAKFDDVNSVNKGSEKGKTVNILDTNKMSVNTYEYECMRAELLGIEKPNLDEFIKKQKEHEKREIEDEEIDIENMKVSTLYSIQINIRKYKNLIQRVRCIFAYLVNLLFH